MKKSLVEKNRYNENYDDLVNRRTLTVNCKGE